VLFRSRRRLACRLRIVGGIRDLVKVPCSHLGAGDPLLVDWTIGCVAVTDSEIEELYRVVPDGTLIEFRP